MKTNLLNLLAGLVGLCWVVSSYAEMADTVYFNGPVVTVDDNLPLAEAVAVKDGRILAVGSEVDILALAGEQTRRVDLNGKALLPGFVRIAWSHLHDGYSGRNGQPAATA